MADTPLEANKKSLTSNKNVGNAAVKAAKYIPQTAAAAKGIEAAEKMPVVGKAVEEAKNQLGKQIKKKILIALIPYLPFILLVLGILIVVIVIVLAIIGFINGGSGGKTAFKIASAAKVMTAKADAGDTTAKNEMVALKCGEIMDKVDQIPTLSSQTARSNAVYISAVETGTNTSQTIDNLKDSVFGFCTSNPTSSGEIANFITQVSQLEYGNLYNDLIALKLKADADGNTKISERIKEILTIFDSLNITPKDNPNYQGLLDQLSAKIIALDQDLTQDENSKYLASIQLIKSEASQNLGKENAYSNIVNDIKKSLQELGDIVNTVTSAKLIISGNDKYYINTYQVDARVLDALHYLVTPTSQGGAGFRKIKVRRIKSDYDTDNKQFSKEWEFTSDDDRTISPHFSGQAMDISGIDMVNRSLYKSGYVRKKREIQAPVDIMVSYQSNIPGKTIPGSSTTSTGFSFGTLSSNQALTDLFAIIGEESGYDFSKYKLEGATLPEIAKTMGLIVLNEELSIKLDSQDDNSSQENLLLNLGKNYIADYFSLPKEGLKGDTQDDVQTNIGREVVATRMKMAALSLSGSTSSQIFDSVGKRKIEKSFGLRLGSLDYLSGDFSPFVGEVLIESKLNLGAGSFTGNDLNQIKNKVGIDRFNNIFTKNPDQVDVFLNLPSDRAYTKNLLEGGLSVYSYKKYVGDSLIKSVSKNFQAQPAVDRLPATGYFNTQASLTAQTYTKKDDAWDMPYGSVDGVISGDYSIFSKIGVDEVAKRLVDDESEREFLRRWFTDPNLKTQPLDNLRFINSAILGEFQIKTLSQIRDVKVDDINYFNNLIKLKNDEILGLQSDYKRETTEFDKKVLQFKIESAQKELEMLQEQLKIAGGKVGGNEDEWSSVDQNAINSALGLPLDGITKIFQLDEGDEVFYMVGGAKIDAGNNLYNPDAVNISNGKINFINTQIKQTNDQIVALELRKAGGETGLDDDISTSKRTLVIWENQLRMEQTNKEEMQANLNKPKTQTKDADIKANFTKFSDIGLDINSAFMFLGSQKMESSLNLPAGSLSSIFDYTASESVELTYLNTQRAATYKTLQDLQTRKNKGEKGLDTKIAIEERNLKNWDDLIAQQRKQDSDKKSGTIQADPVLIGKRQIEEVLRIPKGSFGGNTVEELTTRLGGIQNLYRYFAISNANFTEISSQLPITEQNSYYFKSILKGTDDRLSIFSDTTYDLLKGNITPDQYANKVGIATIRTRSVDTLGSKLGLEVGGYALTGSDVTAMLNGDYLAVLLKVGAKNIDSNIQLPIGTVKAMIDNPSSNCQVRDPASGLQQSCLENLLVANGQEKLARYMGVFGQTGLSNNITEKMGQVSIEKELDLLYPYPKLSSGWFEGDGLVDMSRRLALSSLDSDNPIDKNNINLINKTSKTPEEIIKTEEIVNQYGKMVLAKFGFVNNRNNNWTVYNIEKINFIQNSEPYNLAKRVDEKLGLSVGTTARFFNKEITTTEYKNSSQKSYMGNKALDLVFDQLPDGPVKDFIKRKNIDYSELKTYFNMATDPILQKAMKGIIENRVNYAEGETDNNDVMGQVIIENKLGPDPIGWFDAITPNALRAKVPKPDGTMGLEANSSFNVFVNGLFNTLYDAKVQTMPISNKDTFIQSLKKSQLELIAINRVYVKSFKRPDVFDSISSHSVANIINAENEIMIMFGINPQNNNFTLIQSGSYGPGDEVYEASIKTDNKFKIKEGSTLDFIQGRLDTNSYKERVRKAYINYGVGEIAYNTLLSDDMQEKLAKYGIDGSTLQNVLNNPNAVVNSALMTIINPADLYTIMGLGDVLGFSIPIKGDFPDNFAQKVVEERLGLKEGSFSPNSNIDQVIITNTPKKFAASFRITTDYSKPSNEINTFIANNVIKDNSDYWSNSTNVLRSQNIDGVLKLSNDTTVSNPTQSLLQKKISISQYLELVRKNQFTQLEGDSFANDFTSFLSTSGEDTAQHQKTAGYLALTATTLSVFKDPKLLKDQNTRLTLFRTLKATGEVDLDDRAGFAPGTMENIILNPGDAKSILFSQGLRSVAQKKVFGDAEPYKNNLLILFQYYLPDSINNPGYYVSLGQKDTNGNGLFNPNSNSCVTSTQTNMTDVERQKFISQHRTLCASQMIDTTLHDLIKDATIIKDKNGQPLPNRTGTNGRVVDSNGIDLPLSDIQLLEKGDMGVFTNISLAYAVNRVRAEQDPNGNNFQLIPPDFYISYAEIKAAMNPDAEQKKTIEKQDMEAYDRNMQMVAGADFAYISKEDYLKAREDERKKSGINAKKEIQYRYFDAQLMTVARANNAAVIPAGFTKTMLTGTDSERSNMLLAYGVSNLLLAPTFEKLIGEENLPYAGGLRNALSQFVSDKNIVKLQEYFTNGQVVRDPLFLAVDNLLADDFKKLGLGTPPPKGLAEYILVKGYSELGGNVGGDELKRMNDFGNNVVQGFTVNLVSQFLDKRLGLKPGTAQGMYGVYKAYKAVEAAKNAQVAYSATSNAFVAGTATQTELDATTANLAKVGNPEVAQANMINLAVSVALFAFSDELAVADQKANLPPGSTSSIISFGTSWATYSTISQGAAGSSAMAAGVWIAAAVMVYTIVFGFNKVEYQITCPGDYTFSSWCTENPNLYTQWAQINTRKLINDMLLADERIEKYNLIPEEERSSILPTILGTFRKEDSNYFNGIEPDGKEDLISKYYGGFSMLRGIKGLHQSDYMAEFVHIGY